MGDIRELSKNGAMNFPTVIVQLPNTIPCLAATAQQCNIETIDVFEERPDPWDALKRFCELTVTELVELVNTLSLFLGGADGDNGQG